MGFRAETPSELLVRIRVILAEIPRETLTVVFLEWMERLQECVQVDVSMSDELKERNILKLILLVRFACATLDVGNPIRSLDFPDRTPTLQVDRRTPRAEHHRLQPADRAARGIHRPPVPGSLLLRQTLGWAHSS
jgi:hypothetical protein